MEGQEIATSEDGSHGFAGTHAETSKSENLVIHRADQRFEKTPRLCHGADPQYGWRNEKFKAPFMGACIHLR
jgi:hypothetical protein